MADSNEVATALKDIAAIQFRGSIFISGDTYAELGRFVAKAPPAGCHLEVTIADDGTIKYSCVGGCPSGQECSMEYNKDGGDLNVWCACQPTPGE